MRIAICDDEKEIRTLLSEKIRALYPGAELFLYKSGAELLLSNIRHDILLLDIQMPGKNGMETATELRRDDKKTVIIFVTALEDYVFQAFDVNAFHYLVKPFDDAKLARVLANAVSQAASAKTEEKIPDLMITAGGKHITVNPGEIIYAEVFDRKIILHTAGENIEFYGKMKELEKKLGDNFYRPHRAYLVNFDYIRKYDASTIYFENGQALMAKQNYQDFVKSYLRHNRRKGGH
ncbi:MAG: response regulator transcription factor [Butyrivibrio sp.]|nr:response regulator transcription factor [Butyrivibrio sp.]